MGGLNAVEWRKISFFLYRESNPGRPACSPSLYRLSYSGFWLVKEKGKLKLLELYHIVEWFPI
jgi:hypothetical protein